MSQLGDMMKNIKASHTDYSNSGYHNVLRWKAEWSTGSPATHNTLLLAVVINTSWDMGNCKLYRHSANCVTSYTAVRKLHWHTQRQTCQQHSNCIISSLYLFYRHTVRAQGYCFIWSHKHGHIHSIWLPETRDPPVWQGPLPLQNTTFRRKETSMTRRDSNPQSQQASGHRPTPLTARPPGLAQWLHTKRKYVTSLLLPARVYVNTVRIIWANKKQITSAAPAIWF
jgi:hypothetical protein